MLLCVNSVNTANLNLIFIICFHTKNDYDVLFHYCTGFEPYCTFEKDNKLIWAGVEQFYNIVCAPSNITKTSLFKYIENFTTKNEKFSDKNSDVFFMLLLKT